MLENLNFEKCLIRKFLNKKMSLQQLCTHTHILHTFRSSYLSFPHCLSYSHANWGAFFEETTKNAKHRKECLLGILRRTLDERCVGRIAYNLCMVQQLEERWNWFRYMHFYQPQNIHTVCRSFVRPYCCHRTACALKSVEQLLLAHRQKHWQTTTEHTMAME